MAERPIDTDVKQQIKDTLFTKNDYRLDDRFVIRDGKRHPFAIVVPGGAYAVVCSFIEGVPYARKLNEKGISVFILYYHVRKKAAYPAPQKDLARAVKEVFARKDEYLLDTEGYSVWGSSAGGHLTASFGTKNMGFRKYDLPAPAALVLVYPVISMENGVTHPDTQKNLLGKDPDEKRIRYASVDKHVDAGYPPTYIWSGDSDKTVPPENTKRMDAALTRAGVDHVCRIFPGVDHGVGPATGLSAEAWIDEAADFWLSRR